MDLCWQSNISAFYYAVWVDHSFSSKEKASFNFMAAVTICSDFGAQENKVWHCVHCFPIEIHPVLVSEERIHGGFNILKFCKTENVSFCPHNWWIIWPILEFWKIFLTNFDDLLLVLNLSRSLINQMLDRLSVFPFLLFSFSLVFCFTFWGTS